MLHLLKCLCLLGLSQKSQGPCASLGPVEVEAPVSELPLGPDERGPPAPPPMAELPLDPVGEEPAVSPSVVEGPVDRGPTEPPPVTGPPLGPVDEGPTALPPGGPVVGAGVAGAMVCSSLGPGGATMGGRFPALVLDLVRGVPRFWGSIVTNSRQIERKRVCAQIHKIPQR